MSTELIARAELFASIEGGSIFWANEIVKRGALEVKEPVSYTHLTLPTNREV